MYICFGSGLSKVLPLQLPTKWGWVEHRLKPKNIATVKSQNNEAKINLVRGRKCCKMTKARVEHVSIVTGIPTQKMYAMWWLWCSLLLAIWRFLGSTLLHLHLHLANLAPLVMYKIQQSPCKSGKKVKNGAGFCLAVFKLARTTRKPLASRTAPWFL